MSARYAELVAATNFSFLRGASEASDMVATAIEHGYAAIGIADRNSVAGVVRAWRALRDAPEKARIAMGAAKKAAGLPPELTAEEAASCDTGLKLLTGARLVFADGTPDIVAYPATRYGWGRLTRLLTLGNRRAVKGDCILHLDDLAAHLDDLLLIVLPDASGVPQTAHREPPGAGGAGAAWARVAAAEAGVPGGPWREGDGSERSAPRPPRHAGPGEMPADTCAPRWPPEPVRGDDGVDGDARSSRHTGLVPCATTSRVMAAGEYAGPWPPEPAGGKEEGERNENILSFRQAGLVPASTTPRVIAPQPGGYAGPCSAGHDGLGREKDAGDLHAAAAPRELGVPERGADTLARLASLAPGRVWLGAAMERRGNDDRRIAGLSAMAARAGVPLIAVGDALYAEPGARPLHDVLTCIREGVMLEEAGRRLEANAERHLKPPGEMARLFRRYPDAIAETLRLAARVTFDLGQLSYEYPHEPVPLGWEPADWLEHLVWQAALDRFEDRVPERMMAMMREEFRLIRACGFAYYFLTVHDIVRFARSRGILCQGRGSAANSVVCFLLGVTSVDPMRYDLLFSRFVSEQRGEPPDIDVDFEHERREEVMQYIYERYGRDRAGIAATVIHYRPRSAVREVGKALGLTEDVTARLADTAWGSHAGGMAGKRYAEAGFDPANPEIARLRLLVDQLLNFPRHLSQHVGGFVLTQGRLDEMVPIHNGAMEGRTFIEWDKDDIDALKLMKVDVLALGMLTCIRKGFDLMRAQGLGDHTLEIDLKADDKAVYDMLCKGHSIGVFQVESRAQINMLPRLAPRTLYDLTIQVAIVRPGPIEGDMVHPYLRRRSGVEKVDYPSPAPPHDADELRDLLGKTEGVPLFQEQAMKLAIVAAGFTPDEANELRRAMATFRNAGTIHTFEGKMVEGMVARGYERAFAERCYRQIEGFGSYGFPESHALSFARLVYVSAWLKCHHPAVFACALLNSQPMGFYAPAQIVREAQEIGGVEVRGVDVNASEWDNTLEPGTLALRLGFRQLDGFREEWATSLVAARAAEPFDTIEALARRANLPRGALDRLAQADAFGSLGLDRRAALWEARRTPTDALPLFAAAAARELGREADMALPAMRASEHVAIDYQTLRLSLRDHPMRFLRPVLAPEGVATCAGVSAAKAGTVLRAAGIVLVRQRPGKGNAIFVTLEDETGITNVVLWARLFEQYRRAVMASRLMEVWGEVQKSPEGVVHLMARRVRDRSALLTRLTAETGRDEAPLPTHPRPLVADRTPHPHARHPRDVRLLPKSRDFH